MLSSMQSLNCLGPRNLPESCPSTISSYNRLVMQRFNPQTEIVHAGLPAPNPNDLSDDFTNLLNEDSPAHGSDSLTSPVRARVRIMTEHQLEAAQEEASINYARLVVETSSDEEMSSLDSGSAPSSPVELVHQALLHRADKVVFMSSDLAELKRLLETNTTCLVCKKAVDIIDASLLKTADIPIRDDSWIKIHTCGSPTHKENCPAFRLPDWQYSNVLGHPSPNFIRNMRRSLTASTMILNICDSKTMGNLVTNAERKQARHSVAGNPYIIYGCHLRDKDILPLEGNESFFHKLYHVRKRVGYNTNFGYQDEVKYTAQASRDDEDLEDGFSEQMPSFREKVSAIFLATGGVITNWAETIVKIFFKCIGSVVGLISAAFGKVGDMMHDLCVSVLKKLFNLENLMKTMHSKEFQSKMFATFGLLLTMTIFVVLGIDWYLTKVINKAVIKGIVNYGFEEKIDFDYNYPQRHKWHPASPEYQAPYYKAQNSRADPVAAAVMLGCYIWNIDGSKTSAIKQKANAAMDMMKLGTVVSCTTACVYALLPVVLKECIASALETPENRLKREALEWCGLTNELGKMQQIPSVMSCAMFKVKVDEQQTEGQLIINKLRGPTYTDVRTFTIACLVKLYAISAVLLAMATETRKRAEPFSIHICGDGGVGKSLLGETLLLRALDVDPEDIFAKNCGEEFWSGYYGQKAVIMDEFCVGSAQTREQCARQYLGIVSSAQTRLEMASLNDVRVGIKGTCFTSDYVMTINNIRYDSVDGINKFAFWRRRDVVIEFTRSADYRTDKEGNIDFSLYTPEEIREAVFVECTPYPRAPVDGFEKRGLTNKMTYPALCDWLRERYMRFVVRQKIVAEALGSVIEQQVNPEQMIENVYRKAAGIPAMGTGLMDSFKNFVFGSDDMEDEMFEGQGDNLEAFKREFEEAKQKVSDMDEQEIGSYVPTPDRPYLRHNHVCQTCGERRRHQYGDSFRCEVCDETDNECKREENEPPAVEILAKKDEVYLASESPHLSGAFRVRCCRINCPNQKGTNARSLAEVAGAWLCEEHRTKFDHAKNVIEINRSIKGLPMRLDIVHLDKDSWEKAIIEELKDIPVRFWYDVISPTYKPGYEAYKEIRDQWFLPIKIICFGAVIAGAVACRSFRVAGTKGESEEEEVTFGSQALYDRSTRTKEKKSSLFQKRAQKGAKFEGQSLNPLKALRLKIGEVDLLCVPIGGHDLLTFHHSVVQEGGGIVSDEYPMELTVGKESYKAVFSESCVRSFPERDFMVIRFDNKQLPQLKDVKRRFLTRDEIDDFSGKVLVKVESPRVELYSTSNVTPAVYHAHNHKYEMPKMLRYFSHTQNGDCGSPVLLATGNDVGKIVGIHVAGTGDILNPQGLATFVAREDLEELVGLFDDTPYVCQNMDTVSNYQKLMEQGELPNLAKVAEIPLNRRMHCHEKTKLKPSAIAEHLGWPPEKAPAVLSQNDFRANGLDPIDVAVKKLGSVPSKDLIRAEEVDRVKADMIHKYMKIVDESPYAERPLDLEEAVGGVPGLVKSMDTSTAAGYPLGLTVRKGGKKSLITHIEGKCVIHEDFVRMCDELEAEMNAYNGDPDTIDYAFQAFAKDELRSKKKINNVDTRLTYANDMRFNAVVRKYLMPVVLAITQSFGKNGMAISLNPQSFDMSKIYGYLREVQPDGELLVIDGDFSEFDISHDEKVIKAVFDVMFELMKRFVKNESFWQYVFDHETKCGATVKNLFYKFIHILCSGSQFTTLFNCLANEMDFRILFNRKYPHLVFDKEVRAVVLGDDHLVTTTKKVDWTPVSVGKGFEEMGLKYTSARKNEELKDTRTPFGECLFLGSVPQRHHGNWSGALRKETLRESLLWTRNNNATMDAEVVQMMEAATQWDKEFYTSYVEAIQDAYSRIDRPFPKILGSYEGLGYSVANRTTDSGADYPIYRAQSSGALGAPSQSVHEDGMTTLLTDTMVGRSTVPQIDTRSLAARSLNERSADITFGAGSLMKRLTVPWSYSQVGGTAIINCSCPFGMLGLADQNNLQNMAFQSFLYNVTSARVVFQVNGTPTQAGLLIAYWVPLLDYSPDRSSKSSFQHVWLTPHESTTAELNIPFLYWRSALNSTNAAYYPEVLGRVRVEVFSPLVSLAQTTCDVTMFVSFDADFKIPRPIPVAPTQDLEPIFGYSKNSNGTLNAAQGVYTAQGSNVSTTNVNSNYTVGDVAGDMPIQVGVDGGGKQQGSLDLSVPMDNPPMSGGAVPVSGQFSSMSKSNGTELTTSLQLHQQQMSYQPIHTRSPLDTNIQEMCGKRGYLTRFNWSSTNLLSTAMLNLKLDSVFSFTEIGLVDYYNNQQLPANVAVLNQFTFWKADIVFEICAVKTPFHSGRLMASVAYGDDTVNTAELNVYMNNVLDFNGESSWQSFRINYNNSQEFMRTWNGVKVARSRDYSVGAMTLSVLNELRHTSEVVSATIEVLVFVRFENVRVAVPKPFPCVHFDTSEAVYMAQSSGVVGGSGDATDEGDPIVVDTTATSIPTPAVRPCKLEFGEKFDYCVSDVHELVRRHMPLPLNGPPTSKTANSINLIGITKSTVTNTFTTEVCDVYRIPVRLHSIWNRMYVGWSGHIKYRVFCYGAKPALTWYVPFDDSPNFVNTTDPAAIVLGPADSRTLTGIGTDVWHTSSYPTNIPREMSYPYTAGCSMIDVSIPFCTQYNFLPNYERRTEVPDSTANWGNGYLYIRVATGDKIEIFHAAGDDFRYHVYCPDANIRGRIINKIGATTTTFSEGDRVGGFFMGLS